MSFRLEKLQYLFFAKLSASRPESSIAAALWHGPGRKHSSLHVRASKNRFIQFSKTHTKKETMTYITRSKFESTQTQDKNKDGQCNTAGSIRTPVGPHVSVYLDHNINKDDQLALTYLRLGMFTFHQPCKRCGATTTRRHATMCSGEEARLKKTFPHQYTDYVRNYPAPTVLFQDFMLNKMDALCEVDPHSNITTKMIQELTITAYTIRSTISGYEKSESTGKWYHPELGKKVFRYKKYSQTKKKTNSERENSSYNPP